MGSKGWAPRSMLLWVVCEDWEAGNASKLRKYRKICVSHLDTVSIAWVVSLCVGGFVLELISFQIRCFCFCNVHSYSVDTQFTCALPCYLLSFAARFPFLQTWPSFLCPFLYLTCLHFTLPQPCTSSIMCHQILHKKFRYIAAEIWLFHRTVSSHARIFCHAASFTTRS